MEDLIFGVFFVIFLGIVYKFGYTYAAVLAKKSIVFPQAFGRSLRMVAILTVFFAAPVYIAYLWSVHSFPQAFSFQTYDFVYYMETYVAGVFQIFGFMGLPFFFGVWRKYKKQDIAQPVAS